MIKKALNICILFICTLLLFACEGNKDKETSELVYKTEFPTDSPGLEEFIKNYITSDLAYHLVTEDHINVYAEKNLGSQQKTIEYVQFSDEQLTQFYDRLFESENTKTDFTNLRKSNESLFQPVDDKEVYHLPEITLEKGNVFNIKTSINEKRFKLSDILNEYEVHENDKIMFNVVAVDEDNFQIDVQVKRKEDSSKSDMSIFMTQDLQNTFVSETYTDEFPKNIVKGNLKLYENLFVKLDSEGRYMKAANSFGIADTVENELKAISESDYLSKDNQYVYLDGNENPLAEDKQRIQKIEDYLAENDEYIVEFDLNFKQIADVLDLNSVNDVSIGKVNYFNEDIIVLFLEFKAAITGTAGSTNVIVDFQENRENPTFYLVDLGLH
ncbi:hypothetical protein ACFSKI_10825 [Pseudogracilibacillus auburnensis]|uniref:Uncharacterized protein n=1 Tax=Pseudogracilibacillus auburnensis TaxID=1494959 RepID=A0A2V3VYM1_9BACI|nr:hypothetical protein [Pseudogracilibacillus auburnensis]MBO1001781.1 hypothetical protein [Pseudogracilibacillus auburnensis]PXW86011.1 hypothetical protein DFR56_109174 [Pseudogracilibacillus auburnensis]